MNNLIDRGLIECKGRLDVPGRPMLYGTTSDFLRCFGLESLAKLPTTTEEITTMFQRIKNHESEESPEESIEGGEQMTFTDEILDEITSTDDAASEPQQEYTESTEATDSDEYDDGEPSADDYQDLGE